MFDEEIILLLHPNTILNQLNFVYLVQGTQLWSYQIMLGWKIWILIIQYWLEYLYRVFNFLFVMQSC